MLTKRVQPFLAAMPRGAGELPSVHRGGADIARFTGLNDIVQRFEHLLDRRVVVETMDLIEVDIIHTEPTQAVVDLGEDRFSRKPGAIGAGTHPAVHLGGDDNLVAAPEILNRPAEDFFTVAERIAIGGIEEIDARFERLLNEWPALLLREAPGMIPEIAAAIAHATEANARNVKASAAELGIFHRLCGPVSCRGYWLAASEPLFLVDKVKQRLSGGKAAAILYRYRLPSLAIGRAVDRDMRRDQHVWHAPERVVGGQRLGIGDIEPGSSEMAGAQRLYEIGGPHKPTARDIDEVSATLHPREHPGVEPPYRVRRFPRGQDHK